jgi:hypothetical protein
VSEGKHVPLIACRVPPAPLDMAGDTDAIRAQVSHLSAHTAVDRPQIAVMHAAIVETGRDRLADGGFAAASGNPVGSTIRRTVAPEFSRFFRFCLSHSRRVCG